MNRSTLSVVALLFLALVAGGSLPAAAEEAEPAEPAEPRGLRHFVRAVEPEPQRLQLEIAIRRYASAEPGRPPIDLVAVIHIGEPEYYATLQEHLDQQPLVLFEGVGRPMFVTEADDTERDRAARTRHALRFIAVQLERYHQRHNAYPPNLAALLTDVAEHQPGEARWTRLASRDGWGRPLRYARGGEEGYTLKSLGADGEPGGDDRNTDIAFTFAPPITQAEMNEGHQLQPGVAAALGLVFQLNTLNYDRDHFRHSDMTMAELRHALGARRKGQEPNLDQRRPDPVHRVVGPPGEAGGGEELELLVHLFDGSRFTNAVLGFAQRLLANSPALRQLSRLFLIETLAAIEGDLAAMPGLSPAMQELMQVLIIDRNRIIVRDLQDLIESEDAPESISVFYGAGHMPDLTQQLREHLDYHPTDDVQWLTAFEADMRDANLDPHQVEVIRGLIRYQLRSLR